MCSTAWPRSLPQFLLCTFEKGSWCFYHGGCSKVGILSFLFCQPIAPWHLPSVSVCALHVFHSLTTIPAAVSALSRWERQLMLLCRYLLKSWYSFFFILSTRLDTDTFPPPLCGLFLCSTAWPRSLPQFLLCPVEKGNWCFYHDGCSKVRFFLLFSVKQIAHWLLPSASVWLSMCSTAWPLSLLLFLLCPVEKGSWCFYHDGCSKVGILSFLFCQPIAPWLLPSFSVCALHVFHSLTTIPTAVSALSRWERQLMLLCRYLLKSWYSFFLILSTRLDTDTFPPPLFVLSLCSTAWPWSLVLFLFGYVEKGSRNTKRFVSVFSFFMTQTVIWKVCCFHRLENLLVSLDSWALELLGGVWFIRWRVIFSCKSDKTVGA